MTRPRAGPSIRRARPEEFDRLREVEIHADSRFEKLDIGPFFSDAADDHFDSAALVLAAGDPAVGFICLDMVDGLPHIWQLSVQPDFGRHGIGRALIEAACEWARESGFRDMTLTTFRDVPWNGPFYESMGFEALEHCTPGLQAIREHEREIGDDAFGPRVAMRRRL